MPRSKSKPEEYITTSDVAPILGLTTRGVQYLVRLGAAGPFPGARKVSGKRTAAYLFPKSEVLAEAKRRGLL